MPLYIYLKAYPKNQTSMSSQRTGLRSKFKAAKFFSIGFVLVGIFLLGQVIIPIAGWYIFVLPSYQPSIISPLPVSLINKTPWYPSAVAATELVSEQPEVDSYKPSTWFVGAKTVVSINSKVDTYTISIPKLKIESATVKVGWRDADEDLKKSLLALPTSGLPGVYGNAVIFGHSALPQFSSPKSYTSIFTFLMDLKKGDEMYVDADGVRYKYEVIEKKVVEPTDLSVLEQRYDAAYITLITCVPPGTTWKRGIIRGRLVKYE